MTDPSAIVVAFHNADLLQRCLSSLPHDLPVWVVDNSSDPDVKQVAAQHDAEYLDSGENLGFAGGVNMGLRSVPEHSDVLLLNPDAVITGDALRSLQSFLRAPGNERLAAVSPALVDPRDGTRQRVRWPLPTPGRMWREVIGLSRLAPPPDEYSIGAVLMLRREAIADVGFFDERFFLYAEEADWQRRALERGWTTAELRAVSAEHIGAGTSDDLGRRELLFHAGIETYMRKWWGTSGWNVYRLAALLGAAARAAILRGTSRNRAQARALIYLRGPRRAASLAPRQPLVGTRIAHLVVTEAFAGVERYVSEIAREQAAQGADVTVLGGDPMQMRVALGRARHRPAASLSMALKELVRLGRQDIVHAHMTAAELAAILAAPFHRAPVVSTRHIAKIRGSSPHARLAGQLIRRRLALQIAPSHYTATEIREPSTILWNAVPSQPSEQSSPHERFVLVLQRMEPEKRTDVALRAWALSGLTDSGWRMCIAGSGSQLDDLRGLARDLQVQDSVDFLGHVRDTRALLSRAGLLMATGVADSFGLSVAEAMAAGTPVLASDGGAHPELLGVDGWLYPAKDVEAAATALVQAVSLPEQDRAAYGDALRQRQIRLFSVQRHLESLSDLYFEVRFGRAADSSPWSP